MKKYLIILIILFFSVFASGIDKTSPAYRNYAKGMFSYYVFSDIDTAEKLFQSAIQKDRAFLGGYLGLMRSQVKMLNNVKPKQILDNAWENCRSADERQALIMVKSRYLHDEQNNKVKAGAFIRWAETQFRFRYLEILKKRFHYDKNTRMTLPPLTLNRKTYHFSDADYKRKKLAFLFWHPDVVNMTPVIRAWYSLSKRLGYQPFLLTPVNRRRAERFLKENHIGLPTFTSTSEQDIALLFGIDLAPLCFFVGKDNEILYTGNPDDLHPQEIKKLSVS